MTVALFAGVVIALAQSAPMLILPQYFAIVPRFGPVFGMLAIAPLIAGLIVAGPVAGFLLARFPPRVLVAAGLVTVGLGNLGVALIAGPATGYVLFILPLLLIGAGFVVGTTVRTAIIFASVPRGLPATAAALNEASLAVGTRIGIVLVTAIVATVALSTYDAERQRRWRRSRPPRRGSASRTSCMRWGRRRSRRSRAPSSPTSWSITSMPTSPGSARPCSWAARPRCSAGWSHGLGSAGGIRWRRAAPTPWPRSTSTATSAWRWSRDRYSACAIRARCALDRDR